MPDCPITVTCCGVCGLGGYTGMTSRHDTGTGVHRIQPVTRHAPVVCVECGYKPGGRTHYNGPSYNASVQHPFRPGHRTAEGLVACGARTPESGEER